MRVAISTFIMSVVVGFIVTFALSTPAWTQESVASTPWTKMCTDEKNAASCSILLHSYLMKKVGGKEQKAGRLLQVTIQYTQAGKKRMPVISLQLPLGVNLQSGVVVKIDKHKEFNLPYLQCKEFGCDASIGINTQLLSRLKKGSNMLVGFVAWGDTKTNLMKVPLKGFTNIYKQLK
jgi:invasion protein IalB